MNNRKNSRYLRNNKCCNIVYNQQRKFISIIIIDEINDIVSIAKITIKDISRILSNIFKEKLEVFYNYLCQDDTIIQIFQTETSIQLNYEILLIENKNIKRTSLLPIKRYYRYPPSESQQNSDLSKPPRKNTNYTEEIIDKQQINPIQEINFDQFNTQQILNNIEKINSSPLWYRNKQPNICLKLTNSSPFKFSNQIQKDKKKKIELKVNLNQFHHHHTVRNRYDLVIGFAHPNQIQNLTSIQQLFMIENISLTIESRFVKTQCFKLKQQKQFDKIIQAKTLSLIIQISQDQDKIRIEKIQTKINSNVVNVLNQDYLEQQYKLSNFEQYIPFVYLIRSNLHFRIQKFN